MKKTKAFGWIILIVVAVGLIFLLTSCSDVYTRAESDELINQLSVSLNNQILEHAIELQNLKLEYTSKHNELVEADNALLKQMDDLTETYNSKISDIIDDVESVSSLQTQYKADMDELAEQLELNADKIAALEEDYNAKLSALESKHNADIERLSGLIDALENATNSHEARIAELEAQVALLEARLLRTVEFDIGNAEGIAPEKQIVAVGTYLVLPSAPAVDGYVFDGWYYGNIRWESYYQVNENMTLVAHYKLPGDPEAAAEFLYNSYTYDDGKETAGDYQLIGILVIDGVSYDIEWSSNSSDISLKPVDDGKLVKVDLPDSNESAYTYNLYAKVVAPNGSYANVSFSRVLPVYEKDYSVHEPEVGAAYKLYIRQPNVSKYLFALTTIDSGRYVKMTDDYTVAPDFYVEASGDGYKFYTTIDGAKMYLNAYLNDSDRVSLNYTDTTESVWTFGDYNAWFTTLNGVKYFIGSYNNYETVSLSEAQHASKDGQFMAGFIAAEDIPKLKPLPQRQMIDSTISEIIGIATETYSFDYYKITVTIKSAPDATWGNCDVTDGTNDICVWGLYMDNNGQQGARYDAMEYQPVVGDTITIYGSVGTYNGILRMNIARITNIVKGEGGDVTPPEGGDEVDPPADDTHETVTASKTVANLITEYGWTISTTKQSFDLDDVVSVKIDGGANTGKAYNGDHIRIYATDSPAGSMTISVADGYELVSIKITTVTGGTYAFFYVDGTTEDICNKTVEVFGSSVTLNSVKNGTDGKQVRVTAIEVVYQAV